MTQRSDMEARTPAGMTISPPGMRIIRLLVGKPAKTLNELAEALGITRTAIIEQMNDLVGAGFVERNTERLPGRGRPCHAFRATNAALAALFISHQAVVIPAVWKAIAEIGGEELTQKVLEHVTDVLAERYQGRLRTTTPRERLRELVDLLNEEGGVVEVQANGDGQVAIVRRSCPFITMFEQQRAVCSVDTAMLSRLVGAPVRQTSCRHDGAPCCAFEIALEDGK
jgi:predicted ArsR family transcriptional regulator